MYNRVECCPSPNRTGRLLGSPDGSVDSLRLTSGDGPVRSDRSSLVSTPVPALSPPNEGARDDFGSLRERHLRFLRYRSRLRGRRASSFPAEPQRERHPGLSFPTPNPFVSPREAPPSRIFLTIFSERSDPSNVLIRSRVVARRRVVPRRSGPTDEPVSSRHRSSRTARVGGELL